MFVQYHQYLWIVASAAVLVLVIAWVNLAGLFLVRERARLRDVHPADRGAIRPGARSNAVSYDAVRDVRPVALGIAMVGLYALTSFDVASRRRELGVRMALGAPRRAVLRLVLLDCAKPVIAGLVGGLGLAVWSAPFLQSFLFRMSARPMDAVDRRRRVAGGETGGGMAAHLARRANDPVEVLRQT